MLENYDNIESVLAATVFTDVHHGRAITEEEFEHLESLKETYKEEIEEARTMIATNADFNNLSYEEKVTFCLNLIKELKKNKLEGLKSTLEAAKKLEETIDKIRFGEIQTEQKITEDNFKVYINGTYVEPQATTEWDDDLKPKSK